MNNILVCGLINIETTIKVDNFPIKYSDILFLSNEGIVENENDMIMQLSQKYNHEIIVITMGENGLLMYAKEKHEIKRFSAIKTREVVNTIGAGDALFSCFIHFYCDTKDPYYSIQLAIIFASYKIGENVGSKGFLTEEELIELKNKIYGKS